MSSVVLEGESVDSIVALATPPGRGGVAIVRLSGPLVSSITRDMVGCLPPPRYAHFGPFYDQDQQVLDEGITLFFKSPRSFTGDDVVEFHAHGGPFVVDLIIQRCLGLGARNANPGEFSERAFLNGKLDLAQAEAIADLIESGSVEAARSAVRSLRGEFSTQINSILGDLIALRVYVEAALDFPEEEIDFLSDGVVLGKLSALIKVLESVLQRAEQGALLREGMTLVIAGRPNAGKSSLLNALAQYNSAIVTEMEGTTRDVLREQINLNGLPLHIVDTAGLRESSDPVEKIGIDRAWEEIKKADMVLLLIDAQRGYGKEEEDILKRLPSSSEVLFVFNKIDKQPVFDTHALQNPLSISVKNGIGLEALKDRLIEKMGYKSGSSDVFIARRRHIIALEKTLERVSSAKNQLENFNAGELVAQELYEAQNDLSSITGRFSSDDLLGEIFSSFCIGK